MRSTAEYTRMLGNVKPHVRSNAIYLASKHDISVIGGYRSSGSVPNSDHPKGLAVDYMTYTNRAKGDALVADVRANWDEYNISYVIWQRRFWPNPNTSQVYTGPSPHTDHPHVSYKPTGSFRGGAKKPGDAWEDLNDKPLDWGPLDDVVDAVKGIWNFFDFITDANNWKRIGLALAGGLFLLFGLLSVMRGPQVLDLRKVL